MGRARAALASLVLLASSGCTLQAFIHDKTVGPISPAGHIHPSTVGAEFVVTDEGIQTVRFSEWLFRPYPPDILRRMGQPETFWFAIKGIHAFFYGLSPVVVREHHSGEPLPVEKVEGLEPTQTTAREVLDQLGPPQLWVRRAAGSIMAYKAEKREVFAFWIGTPPFIDIIPGANNFSFRYMYRRLRPFKTILFFDTEDRLLGLVSNRARMDGSDDQEGDQVAE